MTNQESFIAGIAAINARDWDRHRELLAPDVTFTDYAAGTTTSGITDFVEGQKALIEPFPDEQLRILNITSSGSIVMAEMVAEGTHSMPLTIPAGETIAATGMRVCVHVMTVCEYDADGRATDCRAYSNPMELMGQIGALPAIPQQISLEGETSIATRR